MYRMISALLLAFGLLASGFVPLPAQAGPLELFLQKKTFPECHEIKVLGNIVERFNWAEEETWKRGVYMSDIDNVRPRLLRDSEHRQVPRRYCRATATLTNGHHRTVFYLIEGGGGFAGNGFNLEFCVEGLDRWRVHNGSCRTLRY